MLQENLKFKWVVLYGIEVSIPYVIDEVTVSKYYFVYLTNHEGEMVRVRRKDFLTELGKSIHITRFVFNGNYNKNTGKRLYPYK